jgi:hypothetical protein
MAAHHHAATGLRAETYARVAPGRNEGALDWWEPGEDMGGGGAVSELKPGEYVGEDGMIHRAHLHHSVEHGDGWWWPSYNRVLPDDPDFPAAVEALKALIPEPHSCETCVYEAYNDRERWPCRGCSVLPDREDCWRERGHADE